MSSVSQNVLKFYQQLTGEERRVPFIFGRNNLIRVQTDNKSQLSKNTKEGRAADNVYLGETNVSVAYLISFVVFFVTWELTLDL
jgi:uncharacterized membrane protein